jgi:hypothetical protein
MAEHLTKIATDKGQVVELGWIGMRLHVIPADACGCYRGSTQTTRRYCALARDRIMRLTLKVRELTADRAVK